MIKYIVRENINDKLWNKCVATAHNESIYGYTWFLDTIAPNWAGIVNGQYEAVFPLVFNSKLGLKYLCQASFLQRSGIFSHTANSLEMTKAMFAAIPQKFIHWDFCLDNSSVPSGSRLTVHKKRNLILNLNQEYDSLFRNYSKNTRRNLKKVDQSLEIRSISQTDLVVETYKANAAQKEGFALKQRDYVSIQNLMNHCLTHKNGEIIAAYSENLLVGAVFFAYSKTRVYYLFSAVNILGKETKALFAIVDYFINHHAENQLILDFEGSMNPGVARFYKGFGAHEEEYFHLHRNIFHNLFTL